MSKTFGKLGIGLGLLVVGLSCGAEPTLGLRNQTLTVPQSELHRLAAKDYQADLNVLKLYKELDQDVELASRVQRIFKGLIAEAIKLRPSSASWKWEIHTGADGFAVTGSRAGGKLMVGEHVVRRMKLTDAELAGLLGHEIAHALMEHHREELSRVRELSPEYKNASVKQLMQAVDEDSNVIAALVDLSRIQEYEADKVGLWLGYKAGWSPAEQVGFYVKVLAAKEIDIATQSHPKLAQRIQHLRAWSRILEADLENLSAISIPVSPG